MCPVHGPSVSNVYYKHLARQFIVLTVLHFHPTSTQLGRMIGPISFLEAESWLGSCFQTSPIGIVPKAGSPSKFCIICDLSFKGVAGKAVNDWIDTDVPTHWVGFTEFAHFVSSLHLTLPSMALPMCNMLVLDLVSKATCQHATAHGHTIVLTIKLATHIQSSKGFQCPIWYTRHPDRYQSCILLYSCVISPSCLPCCCMPPRGPHLY
jgi:hypothetical protein